MAAGARRRQLPAWMGAAGDERAAAAPSPGAGRRRGAGSAAGAGERPAALYCMNEAELVEVALAVLAESKEGEEKGRSRSEKDQELPATPDEAPGSTANTDGGSDHSLALPSPPGPGADAERTGEEDSEDDVLKYVREIFFS
ncbi:cell cycle regulator of non-homologous end joining [Corvus cornix cornix]|uniref:cell cycle regulator of non-homologous end joining n=1 Tax=Corvus cornix cornix TaxID=932674 RepID=UPI00194EC545|nr:cell cycle regulator of non-homologous end joining [Corvus cornix cornix]